jgi:tol-pal system protein YbgF
MTTTSSYLRTAAFAACVVLLSGGAFAQSRSDDSPGLLDNLFSRGDSPRQQQRTRERDEASELSVRIDRLEGALRQLTGTIEQLQFRNQQLEQDVARLSGGAPSAAAPVAPGVNRTLPAPNAAPNLPPASTTGGRRSDVFDPSQQPNAPGAPRALGGGNEPVVASAAPDFAVGAQGSRASAAPLDLTGNNAANAAPSLGAAPDGSLPPPPPRNTSATGTQVAALPPSAAPKDQFDLGVGYVQRKDYAAAETTLRDFLKKNPTDRLAPDAHYYVGESLYNQKRYQDAADSYLVVVRNYDSSPKAPEALLRLGQSLAALGQKEMACASLNEVARKYPRASGGVKNQVAQEQKRGHC